MCREIRLCEHKTMHLRVTLSYLFLFFCNDYFSINYGEECYQELLKGIIKNHIEIQTVMEVICRKFV